jgi:hypothetical protein
MFEENTSLFQPAWLTGFLDFDNFAAFIVATLGAGAVRHLLFVAVRALGKRMSGEKVVCAPGRGALL